MHLLPAARNGPSAAGWRARDTGIKEPGKAGIRAGSTNQHMTGIDMDTSPTHAGELQHDMIGRVTLRAGSRLLQSAFSPVFEHRDGVLTPAFVTAHCTDTWAGRESVADVMLPGRANARVAAAMHRANLVFRDPESLGYCEVLPDHCRLRGEALGGLLSGAADSGLEAGAVIWHSGSDGTNRHAGSCRLAREAGMKVCATLDGAMQGLEEFPDFVPDIVQLAPQWSAPLLAGVSGAAVLVRSLVTALNERGCAVWMDGIGTLADLQAAIDAGVNLLQGPAIASPVVAGCVSGWRPLNVQALLMEESGAVVPLRMRG